MVKEFVGFARDIFKTDGFIPLHEPKFEGNEKQYLTECIDSTFVSSVGEYVNRFEKNIASYSETKFAVATVNGTTALEVALRVAGVQSGDEVITQALTFVATANAIAYNRASPVFVDVDMETLGLSPKALVKFLNEFGEIREDGTYNRSTGSKIAACVPMHTFGFMCQMDEIIDMCNKWKIPVIEDAAEALGSSYKGRPSGSIGIAGTLSFNGNKVITAGGGGAVLTSDESFAATIKHLTTTAKVPHQWNYEHDTIGYNYRMPNLNAALLCAQLEQLNGFIAKKELLFRDYERFFNDKPIALLNPPIDTSWNYWLMAIKCPDRECRDQFLAETNENGVMTRPLWHLLWRLPMYADCQRDDQNNAKLLEDCVVNIPSSVRN